MDLGRLGLFIVIGGVSVYYGLARGQSSMMIIGLVIAAVGILNGLIVAKKKREENEDK
jgi:hypothetical protein